MEPRKIIKVGKLKDLEELKKSKYAMTDESFIENYPENGIIPIFLEGSGKIETIQIGHHITVAWDYLFSKKFSPEESKKLFPQYFI
jgi:hypothetical protein